MFSSDWSRAARLRMVRLRARMRATEPVPLPPYKGSTLRGAFGHAFRRIACAYPESFACRPCPLFSSCAYAYIFETAPPDVGTWMGTYQNVPRPYVIEPPDDVRTAYDPGDALELDIVLFGRGVAYVPHVAFALVEMGRRGLGARRGRFHLEAIASVRADGTLGPLVFNGETQQLATAHVVTVTGADLAEPASAGHPQRLRLSFVTPTRLQRDGHLVDKPEMSLLVRALLRRVSALLVFHQGEEPPTNVRSLLDRVDRTVRLVAQEIHWLDWERYSNRHRERMKLGGIVGWAEYAGEGIADVVPWLRLAEWVHLGKNAVFGLGKIAVSVEEGEAGSGMPTVGHVDRQTKRGEEPCAPASAKPFPN
ncbi:CRISPR system precrRNA processing endoribonuclease RAMP protein Cas6 [Calditerricola satsumensis]|uniref:CRISPR-associated protein Cas6 n=1 Tax=Calditerricola satsumensis TaxID=373054 RepID=A0A8J3FFK5_9BACI|nr:CRISPR system precrRNA processing endoribonuclease RAMP protein Cas6 [Calditerricola satsumensis]GGK05319.1 CRISPR-associated protein Cas6 [Calditerricola satsumensis]